MKKIIKFFIPSKILSKIKDLFDHPQKVNKKIKNLEKRYHGTPENIAHLLLNYYSDISASALNQKVLLRQNEFKIYSQNGEDGIILFLLSKIKTKSKSFLEIGIQDGRECNTANLSINFGWKGALIEGDRHYVSKATRYYKNNPSIDDGQVVIINEFITAESINSVLSSNGITGEIDLLSIDVDGNDYWIWKAVNAISPRIVIIEYNAVFGCERSITIKYDPNYIRRVGVSGVHDGASIRALEKLGTEKGYALVGCDSSGTNAFFVRKSELRDLKELMPDEAYYNFWRSDQMPVRKEQFEHLEYVEI